MKDENIKLVSTPKGKMYRLSGAYIGVDRVTGKQVRAKITSRTKKGVKLELDRRKTAFVENGYTERKNKVKTFKELATLWLDQYVLGKKYNTTTHTRSTVNLYILPAFGSYKIDKMTSFVIQRQVNKWAKIASHPLKGKTKRSKGKGRDYQGYFNIVNNIFKYGLSLGLVTNNPCLTVLLPKVKVEKTDKEVKFFNDQELKQFFNYMENEKIGYNYFEKYCHVELTAICRFLVATGLRIGEALALSWSDINFTSNSVSITKNIANHKIQNSPKTSTSIRKVMFDKATASRLKKWKAYQTRYFFKLQTSSNNLVFPNSKGNLAQYQDLYQRLLRCFDNSGVPNIGFHGFRHTHASLLLNAGADWKQIQSRLGHSTIAMTMNVYGHLTKERQQEAVELFEKVAIF